MSSLYRVKLKKKMIASERIESVKYQELIRYYFVVGLRSSVSIFKF